MPGAAQPRQGGTAPLASAITDFLRALYAQVLGRGSVGPDDDFFADLNGNSLGAAEIIVTVERIFAVRILEAFFADSTASALAGEIERGVAGGGFDPARAREAATSGPAASGPAADALSRLLDAMDGPGGAGHTSPPGGPA